MFKTPAFTCLRGGNDVCSEADGVNVCVRSLSSVAEAELVANSVATAERPPISSNSRRDIPSGRDGALSFRPLKKPLPREDTRLGFLDPGDPRRWLLRSGEMV